MALAVIRRLDEFQVATEVGITRRLCSLDRSASGFASIPINLDFLGA
jgi:hypothetical protein